tara:strand:+ start:774 stop:1520 length:747 start_codon:yes stop_codon:yes gene_type:complete
MIFKAAIFDLDGVISKTEETHAKAWKKIFDKFLQEHYLQKQREFIEFDLKLDYLEYVDGRPRSEGIGNFLKSRGIELPMGSKDSLEDFNTVAGLGLIKDKEFRRILAKEGVTLYDSTVKLIEQFHDAKLKQFVASSSKNCRRVLKAANLQDFFFSIFDGIDLEHNNLPGKPNPALFLKVIEGYDLKPQECVVFEDSIAGVKSALSGGFFTIGIDRGNNSESFKKEGANIIVRDLSELEFNSHEEKLSI